METATHMTKSESRSLSILEKPRITSSCFILKPINIVVVRDEIRDWGIYRGDRSIVAGYFKLFLEPVFHSHIADVVASYHIYPYSSWGPGR